MSILETINYYYPGTVARLALNQSNLPDGVAFLGAYIELFPNATMPDPSDITNKMTTYAALINQQSILAALAAHRYAVCNGGTILNGIAIQTDDTSRADLTAAFIMATGNSAYIIQWKTPNGFISLNAATIIAIANAVSTFVQKCFLTEATLITNIANYSESPTIIAAFDNAMRS